MSCDTKFAVREGYHAHNWHVQVAGMPLTGRYMSGAVYPTQASAEEAYRKMTRYWVANLETRLCNKDEERTIRENEKEERRRTRLAGGKVG